MGRVVVDVVVSNYSDLNQLELGNITPDKVRRVVVSAVVDTGAARLVLPGGIVNQLGLPVIEQSAVRFADHRKAVRDVVKDAYVELLGRGGMFKAVVEPNRTDALLGAIVMEDLDLIVDCVAQKVMPRDPDMILTEVE